MPQPEFGKVIMFVEKSEAEFYRRQGGSARPISFDYGYVRPNQRRPNGRDVHFYRSAYSRVIETEIGKLNFIPGYRPEINPRKGDRLVFLSRDNPKGPSAFQWSYASEWEEGEGVIAKRPWPECPLCRVVRREDDPQRGHAVLWEGYRSSLIELVSQRGAPFPQDQDEWYTTIWCEEFKAQGWDRMWNPLDPSILRGELSISEEKRQILQRFELARLICEGEQMRLQMNANIVTFTGANGKSSIPMEVDEIGCALLAKYKDLNLVLELFGKRKSELPESDPEWVLGNYVCAELLGFSPELIRACTWEMFLHAKYDPQHMALCLRTASLNESEHKPAVVRYRQLAEESLTV